MTDEKNKPLARSSGSEIEAFLGKVAATPVKAVPKGQRGRLIFAMDATASRQPTWDTASHIQAEMFQETETLGGLEIQLAYYRGFREFKASTWTSDAATLLRAMTSVFCLPGRTQIGKLLRHAVAEAGRGPVRALVFVGDCFEERLDPVAHDAGQLNLLGVPCFLFHEGDDRVAAEAFRHIARLSGGACCRFDANSAQQLRELLAAVAVYAAGGRAALEDYSDRRGGGARRLRDALPRLTHSKG